MCLRDLVYYVPMVLGTPSAVKQTNVLINYI